MRPVKCAFRALACALLAFIACAPSASAQQAAKDEDSLFNQDFVVNIGGFLVGSDTEVRIDGSTGRGTEFDFESELDTGGDSLRLRADFLWRITPRNHIRGLWFSTSRDGHRTLQRDIKWRDLTFHAGTEAEARTRYDIFEGAYEYAFVHSDKAEVAAGIGIHYVGLDLEIEADATDAMGNPVTAAIETAEVKGPFPVVGIRGAWRFGESWYFNVQAQILPINFSGYDGLIHDYRLDVSWMANRHFGLGAGYNLFIVDVDADNADDLTGRVRWGYDGILGYVTFAF